LNPLPFIPDHSYNRRRDIHGLYGGGQQGGISYSARFPYIFIFSSSSGHQHGYTDRWLNEDKTIFAYSGEGQFGDMRFVRGNLALRDHKLNGKRVFLFESDGRGWAKFICEVEFYDSGYEETHDTSGSLRQGIVFFLKRVGANIIIQTDLLNLSNLAAEPEIEYKQNIPTVTERKGLVTTRIGQGAYRKSIVYRWDGRCAVTGFDKLAVLIASHIVPWAESTNNERIDINNGILLSPAFDALFDRHLITFENSGKIILSDKIESQAYQKIGVSGFESIKSLSSDNLPYLEKHRLRFHDNY